MHKEPRRRIRLAGTKEAAALLGVTGPRISQLARTHADFPEPVDHLSSGRVWLLEDLEEWNARNPRQPKANAKPKQGPARSLSKPTPTVDLTSAADDRDLRSWTPPQ